MANTIPSTQKEEQIYLRDSNANKCYIRGKFLGKGGFAKCYEVVIDENQSFIYACKIVPKALLAKQHQKEKMASEVAIHRSLSHINIVKFFDVFEDQENVYVILELCSKRSLLELHKRRRVLTEPEVRYYMKQIVEACIYLHDNNIIHRDLKLGNLFIDENLMIKIGDFGLATKVTHDGERKTTLCGTPNYIAPEILSKCGHSFEVDVWSLGCILYTLCVGQPPFETSNLKDTYNKIKSNDYYIPSKVSPLTQQLIVKLLHSDPCKRPKMQEVINDEYFYGGFIPEQLPVTSLTSAPRFSAVNQDINYNPGCSNSKQVLQEYNKKLDGNHQRKIDQLQIETKKFDASPPKESIKPSNNPLKSVKSHAIRVVDNTVHIIDNDQNEIIRPDFSEPNDFYINDLKNMLLNFMGFVNKNPLINPQIDEAEDPSLVPFCWVCRWVDYSDKYGLGYQTIDGCAGVYFNDKTHLVSSKNGGLLIYVNEKGEELVMDENNRKSYEKKISLNMRFQVYMDSNLVKTGGNVISSKTEQMSRLHYVVHWFRGKELISFLLNCGLLQLNFFEDHVKIIICSRMEAITYISNNSQFKTYKIPLLMKFGCNNDLLFRLKYALSILETYEDAQLKTNKKQSHPPFINQPRTTFNNDEPINKLKQTINNLVINAPFSAVSSLPKKH